MLGEQFCLFISLFASLRYWRMLNNGWPHGKTQNSNESFNGMIWNRVPKATHVGWNALSLGIYDAIAHFNIGEKAALDITELLKIHPGYYMTKCCRSVNIRRKRSFIYRMSEPQKKRRKVQRHSIKKQQEKIIETEGTSYEKGSFENLEGFSYYLKLNWKPVFTFSCYFITTFSFLLALSIFPIWRLDIKSGFNFQVVGYDTVDTFTKSDGILICRLKIITPPVLPLACALIITIMPLLWIFLKTCYFHAFL